MNPKIIIEDAHLKSGRITNNLEAPPNLKKHFNSSVFYAQYDEEITAEMSILNIPAVSAVLPMAWIKGWDIQVNTLDKNFIKSMNNLQQEYVHIYPKVSFKTKIFADRIVENSVKAHGMALTFSGGLDSVYSMISNIDSKPRLIMLFPFDAGPSAREFWTKVTSFYSAFARQVDLPFNNIETNIRWILTGAPKWKELGQSYWAGFQLPTIQAGITAPLSIGRFDILLCSAGRAKEWALSTKEHPWGMGPNTTNKIAWADLRVRFDGAVHRHEKCALVGPYLKKGLKLRVCCAQFEKFNCCKCDKCLLTIVELLAVGIDPNICGFEVNSSTLINLKARGIRSDPYSKIYHWIPLQKLPIPQKDLYGSQFFFKWLKTLKLM